MIAGHRELHGAVFERHLRRRSQFLVVGEVVQVQQRDIRIALVRAGVVLDEVMLQNSLQSSEQVVAHLVGVLGPSGAVVGIVGLRRRDAVVEVARAFDHQPVVLRFRNAANRHAAGHDHRPGADYSGELRRGRRIQAEEDRAGDDRRCHSNQCGIQQARQQPFPHVAIRSHLPGRG